MGYRNVFFGLDLKRLQSLFNSNNTDSLNDILNVQSERIEEHVEITAEDREEGEAWISLSKAIQDIVNGDFQTDPDDYFIYGEALSVICEYCGQVLNDGAVDYGDVREHYYDSELGSSGPPIPIPSLPPDSGGYPIIGHLFLDDIPKEIARIDAVPPRPSSTKSSSWLDFFDKKGRKNREWRDECTAEDTANYRAILVAAKEKNLSVVSFLS